MTTHPSVGFASPHRACVFAMGCGLALWTSFAPTALGAPFELLPKWSSGPSSRTTAMAWGDFDGDGDLDLACGNWLSNANNTLYENLGTALAPTPVWSSEPANTFSLVWGDVDGDGDLDLACGNGFSTPNTLYENVEGSLSTTPVWTSSEANSTSSLAWGDVDGDGDLDLACGNSGSPNTLYENIGGTLSASPTWFSESTSSTRSVAWGDVDGDGDLDLACANLGSPNTLYENVEGSLSLAPVWFSGPANSTSDLAWGDVDRDGDLDLLCANKDQPIALYENAGGVLSSMPSWSSSVVDAPDQVAWGDMDGDGDLDLACGNKGRPNTIYENEGGTLSSAPAWTSLAAEPTQCVAWGDVDGDGDLDLVFGNENEPNRLYENVGGGLSTTSMWVPIAAAVTNSIAWGDVDQDGDLDLACGNEQDPNTLYENVGGVLSATPIWSSSSDYWTTSVAWGDVDGDGDLDLACGNDGQAITLYENVGGSLSSTPAWTSQNSPGTLSLAWGDVDGDGDLDLACGGKSLFRSNALYLNEGGTLATPPAWVSSSTEDTYSVAWGDVDGDGDLDLACGNGNFSANTLYENVGGSLSSDPVWSSDPANITWSVAWGDVDGDGDLDLACGNRASSNTLYENVNGMLSATPKWSSGPGTLNGAHSLAWGDMDGDGDLDLAFGNGGFSPNTVYENVGGELSPTPKWSSASDDGTRSVAWADVDGDGDLDLAGGNSGQPNTLYGGLSAPVFRASLELPVDHLPNNPAHLRFVTMANLGAPEDNLLRVAFRVLDVESDLVFVNAQFQFEGEPVWRQVDMVGGTRAGPFAASPLGTPATFDWNVERFPPDRRPVVLRLLVSEIPGRVSHIQHVAPYRTRVGSIIPRRPLAFVPTTNLRFPSVTVGDSSSVSFALQNQGLEPLEVAGIDLPSAEMQVTPSPPFTLDAGSSLDLVVELLPRDELEIVGALVIRSNDPLNPQLALAVEADIHPLAVTTILFGASQPLPLGEAVTIATSPADGVRVERAWLYHRARDDTDFERIPMSRLGTDLFGVIPGGLVTEAGIEYYVEVENSGIFQLDPPGAPAQVFAADVEIPTKFTSRARPNRGDAFVVVPGDPIQVDLELPAGTVPVEATLFFRPAGASSYDSSAVDLGAAVPAGRIDWTAGDDSSLARGAQAACSGVQYWVRIVTLSGTILSDPAAMPRENPYSLQTTVQGAGESEASAGLRYRMISIPYDLAASFQSSLGRAGNLGDLVADEPLEFGAYGEDWRAFRHDPTIARYVELPESLDQGSPLYGALEPRPGRAFWIITRATHQLDLSPFSALSTPASGPAVLILQPGWNQIGHPFAFDVAWESVTIEGDVGNPVTYDPSTKAYSADLEVLRPYEGFFIRNYGAEPAQLIIPPLWTSEYAKAPDASAAPQPDWIFTLWAHIADDRAAFVAGSATEAREGPDPWDVALPPSPPGTWMVLASDHRAAAQQPDLYLRDLRPSPADGHRWNLVLRTPAPGEEVSLSTSHDLPEGLTWRLVDREQGVVVDPSDAHAYRLLSAGARDYEMALLIGSEGYVEREVGTIRDVPRQVVLDQNSPNPFNPSTRIRFGLPRAAPVTLAIYDVRGQRVATLHDREMFPPGRHIVLWDGQDHRGRPAASGVYFSRLTADRVTRSRPMVLIR